MVRQTKRYTLWALFMWISSTLLAGGSFSQTADYVIDARLLTKKKMILAQTTITYTNHSPDILDSVFIHLWPNAYSSYETPLAKQLLENGRLDFQFSKRKDLGYIDSLNFTVDDQQASYYLLPGQPDVAVLKLPTPLRPGSTARISTPFRVKLPKLVSRSGYEGEVIVVSQWFPKVAVYDSAGRHPMSYLEQGEFFSDFGNYTVNLTLPSDHVLAATGLTSNTPTEVDTQVNRTTYHIQADRIHDFCWVASPTFKLLTDKVILPDGSEVEIRVYCQDPVAWKKMIPTIQVTLSNMSEWVGAYPYPVCTVVEGPLDAGGGMEYPTLTVIDSRTGVGSSLQRVIAHEIIHNWWYGMLASNERQEPWIDEGFTSYYEDRLMMLANQETPMNRKPIVNLPGFLARTFGINQLNQATLRKNASLHFSRLGRQLPMDLPATDYSMLQYGGMIYYKTAIALAGLEEHLGTETFDRAVQALFEENKFTHIYKSDIQSAFEAASGQNLSWFFDGTLSLKKDADYTVTGIDKRESDRIWLKIKNKNGVVTPLLAGSVSKRDEGYPVTDTTIVEAFSAGERIISIPWMQEKLVGIDPMNTSLDLNGRNNFIKTKGPFKKVEPLRLQWLAAPEDPRRTQIFYTPVMAGNKADKFMLGMALYNRVFPGKNLEWTLVPMYAFGSKKFTWLANIDYYGHPVRGKIREWSVGAHGKSFTLEREPVSQQFFKAEPHAYIQFKGKSERSKLEQKLLFRHVHIVEQSLNYSSPTEYRDTTFRHWVNELRYTLVNKRALNPLDASAFIQQNLDWVKVSADARFRINLGPMKKYFSVRLFAGGFLYRNDDFKLRLNKRFAHTLSGATGENDYLYDQTYIGRMYDEKLAGSQIAMTGGQFKVMTPNLIVETGQTFDWLFAANFRLDAPVKWLPLQLFADIGYSYDNNLGTDLPMKGFQYDIGLALSLFDGAIEAYLPFAMSGDFKDYYKVEKPKFFSRFSFSIDFARINPHKVVRTLLF